MTLFLLAWNGQWDVLEMLTYDERAAQQGNAADSLQSRLIFCVKPPGPDEEGTARDRQEDRAALDSN